MKLKLLSSTIFVAAAIAAGCAGQESADKPAAAPGAQAGVPRFEVDPSWPKIPERYRIGDASSIAIDAQDNVWVLHRPRTLKPEQAKQAAPAIIIFDPAGNFIRTWGGAAAASNGPSASTASTSTTRATSGS